MIGWKEDMPGMAVGLCWTQMGGDIMLVEASRVTGGSNTLTLTGQLGSVMKESAKIAFNWFKSVTYKVSSLNIFSKTIIVYPKSINVISYIKQSIHILMKSELFISFFILLRLKI